MRYFLALFLLIITVFIGAQSYRLLVQRADYTKHTQELEGQAHEISAENTALAKDIQFYQNPANATKELQSKVNYRKPDEQIIILVPADDTTR